MKSTREQATYVVGRHPVLEVLRRGTPPVEKIFLQQGGDRRLQEIRRRAREAGIPVQQVPPERLRRMAGNVPHQGVVALVGAIPYRDVDEMLSEIAPTYDEVQRRKPLLVVLDALQDPHNYGAILRSAVAAGAEGVIVPERHMAPLSPAVIKASAGTAFHIPIARVGNLPEVLDQLKERGYWVMGAAGEGETSVWEVDWDRPLALVIGSEGRGLRPGVRRKCDMLVRIPMRGPAESLNASVAAGILLFAATKNRGEDHG